METGTGTATNPTEAATSTTEAATTTPTLLGATQAETTTQQTQTGTGSAAAQEETAAGTQTETKAEGAPEKYEFSAPEGKPYDSSILEAFEAGAREARLSQDAAQKLLDRMAPKIAERQMEQVVAVSREWEEQSKTDKEFGGDALKVNLALAEKVLEKFGTPELGILLRSTPLGNHPEVIRLMVKVGKAISEDTFVGGTAPRARAVNAAQVLYDNTQAK